MTLESLPAYKGKYSLVTLHGFFPGVFLVCALDNKSLLFLISLFPLKKGNKKEPFLCLHAKKARGSISLAVLSHIGDRGCL